MINNKIQKTKDRLLITQNAHNQKQMVKDAQIKLAFHENKGSFFYFILISLFKEMYSNQQEKVKIKPKREWK